MSFHDDKGRVLGEVQRPPTGPELVLSDSNGQEFCRFKLGATVSINLVLALLCEPEVHEHPEVVKRCSEAIEAAVARRREKTRAKLANQP